MVLKHFILPEEHFKANLSFSHYDPPLTHPTTHPWDYWGGDTKRGETVKNKLTLKFVLGDLKHFQTMFFKVLAWWVQTLNGKVLYFSFL